ncbi:MAG: DUF547 domain-containing protein [Acidobacteriota bacterium]|nr:DUF547 domain-containing protein [Acidobacteriota bacterium]
MKANEIEMAPARMWLQRNLALSLLATTILVTACAPRQPERISEWDASDESNVESIDHSPWQDILDGYVKPDPQGVNVLDYAALAAGSADTAKLAGYVTRLEGIDPREYRRAEQMAYWINFYNARTVKMVLDSYPVDTIREIHQGDAPMTGPWGDVCANVAGQDLTLDQIEHEILRPIWRDKRIHYAVNCAAYSCPQLMGTAFTAANTESLLEAGARAYVNSARGVDVVDDEFIVLSSIYKWYPEDFGSTEKSVIEHLVHYADGELAAFLKGFEGTVDYDYDWKLNQPQR